MRRLVMGLVLAGIVAAVAASWPDVARYLKIKQM
jgi:hypothetical protein